MICIEILPACKLQPVRFPFGLYRGIVVESAPEWYIAYALNHVDGLPEPLRQHIACVLTQRNNARGPQVIDIAGSW